ncbi:hypothetical protein P170DRAFT_498484 [Aspergillus steynii IBT 23096]|uniref:GPI anchored protein n=1 Tax=Aspergillus steynii IBT 23096 TaxID=1392250 RepID=A0A2I2G0Y6_9EURO|nr:uncharacterized protein P170DRAFT_498484 [Aspergillus steynii IBT 23096]PLB46554.1 hypothetical protein P170DRAFT_498484 [Aspergillus steynii IBT 23096]
MNLLISSLLIIPLYISQTLSQDPTTSASKATLDGALLRSQADALTSAFPSATPFTKPFEIPGGNLIQPPSSLVGAIITGIPPSVLAQLIQPAGRESIASDFRAGNTPDWYAGLPADVKDYVTSMRAQVSHGEVDFSATPTSTGDFGSGGGSYSDDGDGGSDNIGKETGGGQGGAAATSSSTGSAARSTGELAGSLVGVMGVLGAVALL